MILKKVSILIPCFNAEQWIGNAIASALDQTYGNIEIVVVDDGSSDGSLEIIQSFGRRIHWESGPNRGGNQTRNRLLELANGEWVQFLDADDYLLPAKIQNQMNFIGESESLVDMVYSPVIHSVLTNGRFEVFEANGADETETPLEHWLQWRCCQTGSALWNTESLRAIGGWNEELKCCQDIELTMRAIINELNLVYFPIGEAVYRVWSEGSVSRSNIERTQAQQIRLMEYMHEFLVSRKKLTKVNRQLLGKTFFRIARNWAKSNLIEASEFASSKMNKRLFVLDPKACNRFYSILFHVVGFKTAERVTRLYRNFRKSN